MRARDAFVTLLLGAAGCGGATLGQLRTRAAFDLGCPEDRMEVVTIDARTSGVRGCGRQATYVDLCRPCANGYVGCECTWVMNTADTTRPPDVVAGASSPAGPPIVVNGRR